MIAAVECRMIGTVQASLRRHNNGKCSLCVCTNNTTARIFLVFFSSLTPVLHWSREPKLHSRHLWSKIRHEHCCYAIAYSVRLPARPSGTHIHIKAVVQERFFNISSWSSGYISAHELSSRGFDSRQVPSWTFFSVCLPPGVSGFVYGYLWLCKYK